MIYQVDAPMDRRLQRSGLAADPLKFMQESSAEERETTGNQSIQIIKTFFNDFATE